VVDHGRRASDVPTAEGRLVTETLTSPMTVRSAPRRAPGTSWESISEEWQGLDAQFRADRQEHRGRGAALVRDHHQLYEDAFVAEAQAAARMTATELLDELATGFGLPWTDLARMMSVSVPAIRKWRQAGGVSPENLSALARVLACMRVLRDRLCVADPVAWLGVPLVEGYTVTARHLYTAASVPQLLDFAADNVAPTVFLDRVQPGWREKYATADVVVMFDDGLPALVPRR